MSDRSSIEWTDATWNPVTGCTEVSPGCDHCYAKTFAERWRGTPGHHFENGFDLTLRPERLEQPLRWKKPRRVFVNSMSDLFHEGVPDDFIARVWAVMGTCAAHMFQVLTKRHGRMRALLQSADFRDLVTEHWERTMLQRPSRAQHLIGTWPLPNVWLGVSVEDQKWADIRIPVLLDTPTAVRFLSCEPLLGPIDLEWVAGANTLSPDWMGSPGAGTGTPHPLIDWVIVGGESGPGARPMHPAWARQLRDQCAAAGVPFHFKQFGEWAPTGARVMREIPCEPGRLLVGERDEHGFREEIRRVGKKAAGRVLDGHTHDDYPTLGAKR
jgi:protein gp37